MQYILNILDEQKQRLEEKNKRTQQLIEMYENHIETLQKENVKQLINISVVQQKIDYIKTEEIVNKIKNNPSI